MAKLSKKKCPHPRWARIYDIKNCELCGTEGLTTPRPSAPVLADGIYKLTVPVPNPYGSDGRSSDWNKQAQIPVGTYFVHNWGGRTEISRHKAHSVHRVSQFDPAFDDLAAALAPIEGSNEEWLDFQERTPGQSWAASGDAVVHHLLATGKLSREEFLSIVQDIKNSEKEE